MSYPVQPPPIATVPPASPSGRPPAVTMAAALLWLMAGVGLIYAIATLAVVPGTVSRFREVTGGESGLRGLTGDNDPEYYVAVVWIGAAIAMALAVIAFALFVVIGLSLRRGSNVARIATLVVSILGVLGGLGSVLTVAAQRSGDTVPSSLGGQLSEAYPGGWIGTNTGLAVAQILGYAVVGILVLTAPRAFFRRPAAPPFPQQAYGMPYPGHGVGQAPAGYPAPGLTPSPGPGFQHPAAGYPAATSAGYPAAPPAGYAGSPSGAYPSPGSQPGVWDPGVLHPPGGYSGGPGYPGVSYESPASYGPGAQPGASGFGPGPNATSNPAQTQPTQDHSPYARPPGHAPDAPFAPPVPTPAAPAAPTAPAAPADPDSPYARPQAQPGAAPAGRPDGYSGAADAAPSDSAPGASSAVAPSGAAPPGVPADAAGIDRMPSSGAPSVGASSAADQPTVGVDGDPETKPPTGP